MTSRICRWDMIGFDACEAGLEAEGAVLMGAVAVDTDFLQSVDDVLDGRIESADRAPTVALAKLQRTQYYTNACLRQVQVRCGIR